MFLLPLPLIIIARKQQALFPLDYQKYICFGFLTKNLTQATLNHTGFNPA